MNFGELVNSFQQSESLQPNESQMFIDFICRLEGFKTRCKNLHWAAMKMNIHKALDEFLDIMNEYEDSLAEGYMGILGQMAPNAVNGIACLAVCPISFIEEVRSKTMEFYDRIPSNTIYKGITSETETFIQNINKYKYLFEICLHSKESME